MPAPTYEQVSKLSRKELLQLQSDVAKAIAENDATSKAKAKADALALIEAAGFSFGDLFGETASTGKRAYKRKDADEKPAPTVKFRHPETGATASGRGKPPAWLVEWDAAHNNDRDALLPENQN